MAKFSQTQDIIRNAPVEKRAELGRVKGFANFSNFMAGLDAYGRPLKGGAKFGSKVAATLNPFMFASTAAVKNRYQGTAVGAKNMKQANKAYIESLKNKAEIALTIATAGGFGGAKAGVKGAVEGAKATKGVIKSVKAAKEGFKAGTTAFKASKLAAKAAAKAGTTAEKTATASTIAGRTKLAADPTIGTAVKLTEPSKGTTLIDWAASAGKTPLSETFKVAQQPVVKVMDEALTTPLKALPKIVEPTKIGRILKATNLLSDDELTLVDKFLAKRKSYPDEGFKKIAADFTKENKDKLSEVALKRSQQAIKAAWKKYEEENPEYNRTERTRTIQEDRGSNVYDKFGVKPMMFKKGGMVRGKSHAEGGEKATIGDTQIEVEGDERIFSKEDTKSMDRDAEAGNYTALGKKYAAAKNRHDKAEQDDYFEGGGNTGEAEKTTESKTKDLNWAYTQAALAGAPYPQVTAAQWALESARGNSTIAREHNNYFGIKYDERAAERLRAKGINVRSSSEFKKDGYYDKMEKKSADYMHFDNPADAFRAHQLFLETNPRYAEALKADNAVDYAKGLKAAGYATDPNYANKLINFFGTESQAKANFGEVVLEPKNLATQSANQVTLKTVTEQDIVQRTIEGLDPDLKRKYQAYKANQSYTDVYAEKLMKDKWNYLRKESNSYKTWEKESGFKDAEDEMKKLDIWEQKINDEFKTWKDNTGFFETATLDKMPISELTMLYPELIPDEYKGKDGNLSPVELVSAIRAQKKKAHIKRNDIYAKRMTEAAPKLLDDAYKALGSIKNSPEFKAMSVEKQAQVIENLQKQIKEFKQLENQAKYYNESSKKARLARNSKAAQQMGKDEFIKEYEDIVEAGKLAYAVGQGGVSWAATRGQTANVSRDADKINIEQGDAFFDKKFTYLNIGDEFKITQDEKDAFKGREYRTEELIKSEYNVENIKREQEAEAQREQRIDEILREAEEVEDAQDTKYDAETEEEIDTSLFSDAQVQEFLNRKDEQRASTGLAGIYEKFKGADQVLQFAGMYGAYKSATEPLPEQRKSQQWQDYMSTMKQRAQSGIAPETKTLLQRQAERTYASDVASIGRMATSGQAALGALSQASRRKYAADMQMGAQDATLREQHFGEYAQAVGVDENMTQQMWERNVYNEAARKRDLKAGLIGQAVKNVRDDIMYNQQYGDGSLYAQLMQESIKEKQEAQRNMKVSQLKTMYDAGYTAEEAVTALGGNYKTEGNE